MEKAFAVLILMGLSAMSSAALITIDFEADTLHEKPNGFSATDFPGVTFSDTVGADLWISANAIECGGTRCLAAYNDFDASGIRIDFVSATNFISLDYGNDQLFGTNPVVDIALTLFAGPTLIAQVIGKPNLNDLMDQTISYSGSLFNRATIFYRDVNGNPATLIETIDNITYENAVPEPTTLALFGMGLAGMGLTRRKSRSTVRIKQPAGLFLGTDNFNWPILAKLIYYHLQAPPIPADQVSPIPPE